MYFLLILFFGSLLSITFMIGRKLALVQSGQIPSETYPENRDSFLKAQYFEELKHSAIQIIKKQGYNGLVATIRFYFRLKNFLKKKYKDLKIKIENIRLKNSNNIANEKKEVSKFLKMISEYKQKIRVIKHRIKEEESL